MKKPTLFFLHLQETRMAMLQNSFASAVTLVSLHVIRDSGDHKILRKFLLMVVGLYIRVLVFLFMLLVPY